MAAQTYGGTSTQTALAPRVNLLPPEIAESARIRRSQVGMVGAGLAAVAVVGLMYTQATAKVSQAEEAKADAVATSVKLKQDVDKLQTVRDTYAQVDASKKTLATAMYSEVLWSGYLNDLTLTIPENVWLTNYSVEMTAAKKAGSGGASGSGPVFDPGLGTVTITGTAFTHDDVAAWLESLAKQKGYSHPYFTDSTERLIGSREVVDFTATTYLTDKALSNRYTKGLAR